MAERRRDRRWPRQLEVRFWKQGEEGQGTRAISTNVSRTGIFVRTQSVLPSGSRMRIAMGHSGRSITIEGVVMRAIRTPAHMQSVMPSGMGVRFMSSDELLEEVLPAIDFYQQERVPGGTPTPPPSTRSPVISTPPPPTVVSAPPPPAASVRQHDPTPTPPPRPAPNPPSGAIGPLQVFPLRFRDSEQFRRVFDRDVKTGGMFITTGSPPALDSIVQVDVSVEGLPLAPIGLQARVVHRLEPPPGSAPGNLLVGMGVQFLDVERAVERLRALLR
jgi:hypothetical protein